MGPSRCTGFTCTKNSVDEGYWHQKTEMSASPKKWSCCSHHMSLSLQVLEYTKTERVIKKTSRLIARGNKTCQRPYLSNLYVDVFLKEIIKNHSLKFREEVTGHYCISTASGEGRWPVIWDIKRWILKSWKRSARPLCSLSQELNSP